MLELTAGITQARWLIAKEHEMPAQVNEATPVVVVRGARRH